MAITYDTTSNSGDDISQTDFNWSHTGTGSNLLAVVVFVARAGSPPPVPANGATYAGSAMSQIATATSGSGGLRIVMYALEGVPSGVQTVAIDQGAATTCRAVCATFAGVASSSALDNSNTNSGTTGNASVALTPNTNNCVIVAGMVSEDGSAPGTGTGESTIANTDNGVWSDGESYIIQTTAAARTMDWTGQNDVWGAIAASFKEAVSGPQANTSDSISITEDKNVSLVNNVIPGWARGIKIYTP